MLLEPYARDEGALDPAVRYKLKLWVWMWIMVRVSQRVSNIHGDATYDGNHWEKVDENCIQGHFSNSL